MKGVISEAGGIKSGILYALASLGYEQSTIEPFSYQDPERWAEFIVFLKGSKQSGVNNLAVIDAEVRKVKEGSSKPSYGAESGGVIEIHSETISGFSRYVTGKTITIDGTKYKCRLLTGGSNRRNNDWYAGGTPTNNEWDRFITREEVITGLPAPVSSDLDTNLNTTDHNSTHNQLWHWVGVYSWCQETWAENASGRASRGFNSARGWLSFSSG